jgi:hypothetical protein
MHVALTLQCLVNQKFRLSNVELYTFISEDVEIHRMAWIDSVDALGGSRDSNWINSFLCDALVGFCPISSSVETISPLICRPETEQISL